MREELLDHLAARPDLKAVDEDFVHLFSSWFNRGFLVLRPIDWRTPANILEKIIRYEAVHAIQDWDDLRNRLEPTDRRCFGFFHPQLVDEPLIFVEVALTDGDSGRDRAAARPGSRADPRQGSDDRGVLLDLEHPEGPGRRLLRQFPDQAGGRGPQARAAQPEDLRHALARSRLRRLAGARAGERKRPLVSSNPRSRPCARSTSRAGIRPRDGRDRAPGAHAGRRRLLPDAPRRRAGARSIPSPASTSATARGSSG